MLMDNASTLVRMATVSTGLKLSKPSHRTLASLLKYFLGVTLSVELKNGRQYRGELTEADKCMNLTLEGAQDITSTTTSSSSRSCTQESSGLFLELSIRGSTIRYIQFPDDCDIPLAIKRGQDRERSLTNRYQRGVRKTK
jgi:small nuclear ribonucleoprotein (snRNP)-like protein